MSVSTKPERTVCVLLPSKEQLEVTVGVKATGQEVFNRMSELLGVKELHFFGLSVVKALLILLSSPLKQRPFCFCCVEPSACLGPTFQQC
ncbi:FERM domain-containing protein 1 [Arapaima gigas]